MKSLLEVSKGRSWREKSDWSSYTNLCLVRSGFLGNNRAHGQFLNLRSVYQVWIMLSGCFPAVFDQVFEKQSLLFFFCQAQPLKQAILNVHIQAQVQITFTSGSLNYVLYKVAGELLDLKARSTSLSLGGLISTLTSKV